ncbi:MAG: protoporphyrinogen oxidase [Verrucomicrobiales bacterium]
MSTAAIIGGGITGLTAAWKLRQSGFETHLFEASGRVGGPIHSRRENGYLAELGPNTLLDTTPVIGELIAGLGLGDRLLRSQPGAQKRFILKHGKPAEIPSSPAAFFTSPFFSANAKLRLLREPTVARAPADAEESLAEFVLRRLGREFLDYAINPFVAGVYAGDPAKLSVREAFPRLHALEQKYGSLIVGQILGARERKRRGTRSKQDAAKLSFDEGLEVLPQSLGESLGDRLHLESPVTRLTRDGKGWRLLAPGGQKRFDAVLLALPAYALAKIEIEGADLAELAQIEYPPVASVVFGFRREDVAHPLDGFGTLVPEVENRSVLGTLFSSSLFANRAPEGHVTLSSYLGGTRAPELARRDPEEILALTLEDLRAAYGIEGEPTFRHLHVFAKAIPQYNLGYGRYRELMDRTEGECPGLFFAGHSRDGISLSDSLASGHDRAAKVEAHLSAGA